jgi:hypothetical protein
VHERHDAPRAEWRHAAPRTDEGKPEGALFKQDGEKAGGESLTPPPGAQHGNGASPAPHSHQER